MGLKEITYSKMNGFSASIKMGNVQSGFRRTGFGPLEISSTFPMGILRTETNESIVKIEDVVGTEDEMVLEFKTFGLNDPEVRAGFIRITRGIRVK